MAWETAVRDIVTKIKGECVALFLGATDAGKTTLIRELHERVGGKVVDGDIGQSWIGPPAAVSLGTPAGLEAGYFVGDVSPRGNLLQVTAGVALMARRAQRPCLIDTDGYISDGAALAYKTELINLVRPDLLVLMRWGDELEYYQGFARKGIPVFELAVEHRNEKTREERARAREEAFRSYFRSARLHRWSCTGVSFERRFLGQGEPLDPAPLALILGCDVRAGWKTDRAASLILERPPHTLATAKRVFHAFTCGTLAGGAQCGGQGIPPRSARR